MLLIYNKLSRYRDNSCLGSLLNSLILLKICKEAVKVYYSVISAF